MGDAGELTNLALLIQSGLSDRAWAELGTNYNEMVASKHPR